VKVFRGIVLASLWAQWLVFSLVQGAGSAGRIPDREQFGLVGHVHTVTKRQHEGKEYVFVVIHEFDREGKLIEIISGSEHHGQLISGIKEKRSSDTSGNIIRRESTWISGEQSDVDLYLYDKNGNQIAESRISPEHAFGHLILRSYDNKGNWIEEIRYSKMPPFFERKYAEHEYERNRRVQTIITEGDGTKTIEKYNSRGLVTESSHYDLRGKLDFKTMTSYDDRGNPRELIRYGSHGQMEAHVITEYKYDEKGNWVFSESNVLLSDGKPLNQTIQISRSITYYD
jgi:hypothetical protein